MTFYTPIDIINSNMLFAPLGFEDEFRQRLIIDKIQNMDTTKSLKNQEDKFINKYFQDICDCWHDTISQRYDTIIYRDQDHFEDKDHNTEDWNQYLATWDDISTFGYKHREEMKNMFVKYFKAMEFGVDTLYEELDGIFANQCKNIKGYNIRKTNLDKVLRGEHIGRKSTSS